MSAPQPPPTPFPPRSAVARAGSFVSRVLWTAVPVGTLGLLGWAPALHIARRLRTAKAWWWLAGLAAAMAGECVLLALVPSKGHDNEGAAAGAFVVTYLITATVYTWVGTGKKPAAELSPSLYPAYETAWMPAPTAPRPTPSRTPSPTPTPTPRPAATPAPAAADMAAEIQADLRELRGFLGGGEDR